MNVFDSESLSFYDIECNQSAKNMLYIKCLHSKLTDTLKFVFPRFLQQTVPIEKKFQQCKDRFFVEEPQHYIYKYKQVQIFLLVSTVVSREEIPK